MSDQHSAPVPAPGLDRRVNYLVESSGLGTKLLSEVAGLSGTHLGQITKGKVSNPTGDTLGRLAVATGADLNWLILGDGEQPPAEAVREAAERAKTRATTAIADSAAT